MKSKTLTIRFKFYSVLTDKDNYWIRGNSRKEVAEYCGVDIKQVTLGADTIEQPYWPDKEKHG